MCSIDGKVVVITGASSGIGEAIALTMAEKGAFLTLCGRDQDRLDAVIDKCARANDNRLERLLAVTGDITSRDCRSKIVDSTVDKFGRLDVLIPNAGVSFPGQTINACTEELYDTIMDTNLKSVFFLIQEASPFLEKSKGVVVCMSSVYGTIPTAASTIYAIAKCGIDHMVRSLALALGPKGIRINAVKPSYVATQITRSYPNADKFLPIHSNNEIRLQPFGGRCCTAEEVAEATLFLASGMSSFITGECIHVDGGRKFFPG